MIDDLIIRKPASKEEFDAMFDLRWRLLRKPWNQPKDSERDDMEEKSHPLIAIINDKIVGTARFHRVDENNGQFRYLAVEEDYRRKGVATAILKHLEDIAKSNGLQYAILNARKTAKDVFLKQGFEIVEEGPTIFGVIEHYRMKKEL